VDTSLARWADRSTVVSSITIFGDLLQIDAVWKPDQMLQMSATPFGLNYW